MDPVRQAIMGRLLATPAVTGKLGDATGIYHRRAPENATTPYIIASRQAGTDNDYAFNGTAVVEDLWTIRAVDRSFLSGQAEDIAAAIYAALHFADLPVTGYQTVKPTRQTVVDYGEADGAEQYVHVGGMYRLELIPST